MNNLGEKLSGVGWGGVGWGGVVLVGLMSIHYGGWGGYMGWSGGGGGGLDICPFQTGGSIQCPGGGGGGLGCGWDRVLHRYVYGSTNHSTRSGR